MGFTASVEGLEEMLDDWDGAVEALEEILGEAVLAGAEKGAEEARESHPYADRSGNLTRSTRAVPGSSSGGEAEAYITAEASYASFVEQGTARQAARPFLEPVQPVAEAEVMRAIEQLFAGVAARFNG